jgi:hypothetical protein
MLSFEMLFASRLAPTGDWRVWRKCKKPLNREIQGLWFNRIPDQAASILLRFCSTLLR